MFTHFVVTLIIPAMESVIPEVWYTSKNSETFKKNAKTVDPSTTTIVTENTFKFDARKTNSEVPI